MRPIPTQETNVASQYHIFTEQQPTNTMSNTDNTINALNKLLRGELSAIETYTQAIEKFAGSPEANILERIRAEHNESAETLRSLVSATGGSPDASSGPWGTFAQAIEGTAKLLGDAAALKALIEGEEHGITEYEEALADEDLDDEAKASIRDALLPALFDHVATLDALRI